MLSPRSFTRKGCGQFGHYGLSPVRVGDGLSNGCSPPAAGLRFDGIAAPTPVVAVVGSANADLHLTLAHLPAPGDTVLAEGSRWLPGGKGANQAAAAARLGATVRLLAAVGDDGAAAVALGGLDDDGVDTAHVRRLDRSPSGVAVVCVDAHGENLIVVSPGANGELRPDDVGASSLPDDCGAVLVSLEVPTDTALAALGAAAAAGCLAVLNAAPADGAEAHLLEAASVVVANEGEAAALAGGRSLAALAAGTGATIVATAGPAGVRAATPDGEELHVPALPAEVVDTVGAGDCFTAALTVALAEGRSLDDALRFATAAATLAVGRPGARNLPWRAEVDELLATSAATSTARG